MLRFEKSGTQTLKIICEDIGTVYCKHGAFIGGEALGGKNFDFEDVLVGSDKKLSEGILKNIGRKLTGEDIRLTKCTFKGQSVTYYADGCKNVHIMHLAPGMQVTVSAMYLLAYTSDCEQSLRFFGEGKLAGNGFVSTTITGRGKNSYVAITSTGQSTSLSNVKTNNTLVIDPDALVCWAGEDPEVQLDIDFKAFIGRTSGESYVFVWPPNKPAKVVIQPYEGDVEEVIPEDDGAVKESLEATGEVVGAVAGL